MQDTLLPEHATPTFSSNVVEQFLHKIPGLSDIFLYWNDDFFLGRPVAASDFVGVTGGGGRYAKLFLSSSPIGKGGPAAAEAARDARKSWLSMLYTTNGVLNAAYGEDKKRSHLLHAPYVFYKVRGIRSFTLPRCFDALAALHRSGPYSPPRLVRIISQRRRSAPSTPSGARS